MRMSRSILQFVGGLSVLAAMTACSADVPAAGLSDDSEENLTFRNAATSGTNLRDGEVVLTFDDGPAASSANVAALLEERGHVGLFFVVSKHLGRVSDGRAILDDAGVAKLEAVVSKGQLVANHTHDHCISGASGSEPCSGRAFSDLPSADMKNQVEWTDMLLRAALARSNRTNAYVPFFRAPGNSWSPTAARTLSSAALPNNAYGPVAWGLPKPGDEDFRCWSKQEGVQTCANRYIAAWNAMPSGSQKAVVLIHDNFANATELLRRVLDGIIGKRTKAGSLARVVRPQCIVGCTR